MLCEKFERYKTMLYDGHGLFIIRGLNKREYSDYEHIVIHAGFVSYFGDQRALQQNHEAPRGEVLRQSLLYSFFLQLLMGKSLNFLPTVHVTNMSPGPANKTPDLVPANLTIPMVRIKLSIAVLS